MYHDVITLFNRYKSRAGDIWFPTVIHNVNVNIDRASVIARMGTESQDKVIVNIKYDTDTDGHTFVGDEGKEYFPPKKWEEHLVEDLKYYVTINPQDGFDFFVVGEVLYEGFDQILDNDFPDGFFDFVSNRYDYVFAVTSVTQLSVIPHFEITGK